jgi:hypothetical protein
LKKRKKKEKKKDFNGIEKIPRPSNWISHYILDIEVPRSIFMLLFLLEKSLMLMLMLMVLFAILKDSSSTMMLKSREAALSGTPVMNQYLRVKQDHAEHLLLFQMGDFFEMFFDDAIRCTNLLLPSSFFFFLLQDLISLLIFQGFSGVGYCTDKAGELSGDACAHGRDPRLCLGCLFREVAEEKHLCGYLRANRRC